jgi:hypothetical protein
MKIKQKLILYNSIMHNKPYMPDSPLVIKPNYNIAYGKVFFNEVKIYEGISQQWL